MISTKEISEKKVWEEFVLGHQSSFFQSWSWGEVQQALGNRVWRLGVFEKEILVGVCQTVKVEAKRGRFLHLRHGPILKGWQSKYFDPLLSQLKKMAKKENGWFIRTSPLVEKIEKNERFFQTKGFRPAPIPGQDAETAWILDLKASEEDLLSGMRKTTRYLIRKAQKLGVEIIEGKTKDDLAIFLNLYQETAKRQAFVPHQGIKEEFEILGKENQVKLFLAKYQGKVLAGALIIFYGNQAVYHHSGSLLTDIPASSLLLWQVICQAKKTGKSIFNFWGVAPSEKLNHPWQGLSLFKMGFGGRSKQFIQAQDLPLSPLYWFTALVETGRRIARGF